MVVLGPGAWRGLHLLTLAGGAAALLYVNRGQWFFADEWEFILRRGIVGAELGLLEPHNEHLSTLPILAYRGLLALFGLHSYLPYVALLIVLHLGLTHLLWRICLRVGASYGVSTSAAAVFTVLGAGAENITWAFQIGFVGSLLFGCAALLTSGVEGPFSRKDVFAWLFSIASIMCSGIGLVMVGIVACQQLLGGRGIRVAMLSVSAPTVLFLVWRLFLIQAPPAGAPRPGPVALLNVPDFLWFGLVRVGETVVGIPGAGGPLVVGLLVWLVRQWDDLSGPRALTQAMAIGAVSFFLFISYGRLTLGVSFAGAPRYVYVATALLLPTICVAMTRLLASRSSASLAAALLLVCLILVHNLSMLEAESVGQASREQGVKHQVTVAAALAARGGGPFLNQQPDPALNPDIYMRNLATVVERGWLSVDDVEPVERLTLEARLRTAVEPPAGALGRTLVRLNPGTNSVSQDDRCFTVQTGSTTSLQVPAGGKREMRIRVKLAAPGTLGVALRADGVVGGAVTYELGTSQTDLILGSIPAADVLLPANQQVELCGVGLDTSAPVEP